LLKTLDDALSPGPLKFFKKKRTPLSERAIAAIFESLGKIGTEKSRPLLQKVEKQQDNIWTKKAEEALRKIAEGEARDGSIQAH
jgi:hypothetical protein